MAPARCFGRLTQRSVDFAWSAGSRFHGTEVTTLRSRKPNPRLELYAEPIAPRSQWNAEGSERTSGTILRTATHAPLCLTSTLLLRLITLSLEPFFYGHKHCSPLQPLRARHVLPVSLSSLIIRWMTPRSEQNSKSDSGLGST